MNIKILACQIIGPAAAGSAGPVPTPLNNISRNYNIFFHFIRLCTGTNTIIQTPPKLGSGLYNSQGSAVTQTTQGGLVVVIPMMTKPQPQDPFQMTNTITSI